MSTEFLVVAQSRSEQGKGASRRLRRVGNLVPGIIYGGESAPEMITIEHNHLAKHLTHEAFYSHILTIEVSGKKQKAVVKAIQRHPYKPRILHIDLMRITGKEKITMHVPLHFKGEDIAPGVKIGKGIVNHIVTEIEVRCLPKDLPEFIEVDLTKLGVGETIHISQIKLPKGVESVELLHNNDLGLVNIQVPRAALEEEAPAASEVPVEPKGKEKTEEKA